LDGEDSKRASKCQVLDKNGSRYAVKGRKAKVIFARDCGSLQVCTEKHNIPVHNGHIADRLLHRETVDHRGHFHIACRPSHQHLTLEEQKMEKGGIVD
jgi:hypothetical protein